MRCGQRLGDVGAGAEAGVDQGLLLEAIQRLGVTPGALRLDDGLSVVLEAKPGEVLENLLDELRPAAAGVEILDPQQELPAAGARMGMAQRRRKGVAEVQPARRRGGETCDLQDSLPCKGDKGDS